MSDEKSTPTEECLPFSSLPPVEPNPCVHKFGRGPDGATCKTCVRLIQHGYHNKRYYKCPFRGDTQGAATDHRVGWNACAYYEAEGTHP